MKIAVDATRVVSELEALAGFSETPSPTITRIVFSPPDMQAREWLKKMCLDADLSV
jgi:ureidoglycolate amidohydrolase